MSDAGIQDNDRTKFVRTLEVFATIGICVSTIAVVGLIGFGAYKVCDVLCPKTTPEIDSV